ncbi:MAG: anthranilate synthase component I family protein, partial [Kiritimatiellae bacterium]|nr:anthranilate synthase component I family protein [Kiritimatiellia bacterium]
FDNLRRTVTVIVAADASDPDAYPKARDKIDELYARFFRRERPMPRSHRARPGGDEGFVPEMTAEEFSDIVAKCKADILNGECIQIVPSQKFTRESDVDSVSLYRALRMVNPSPYNIFMKIGERTIIGSSPEELVKLEGRRATTCPIAGTRPRGLTAAEDAANERDLVSDVKENAEHVMLVDLGRNDLGRVCETGSVKVASFAHVERYSHVMHLVSDVEGTLAPDKDGFDLLRAAFPAGTLTGAPKIRAMELIAQYEKSPRGIYGGAAGYFSYTGDMDFAIVIRTLVKAGRTLTMRAGAGIVADSDPMKEYQETINKSKAVFEAVKFAEAL